MNDIVNNIKVNFRIMKPVDNEDDNNEEKEEPPPPRTICCCCGC